MHSKQNGYTLMEVLIAMILLSIAFVALQKGIVLAQNALISADELRTAESLYQRQMLELSANQTARSQHNGIFSVLQIESTSEDTPERRKQSLQDLSDWQWRATYSETDMSELQRITLTITRSNGAKTKKILAGERLVWLP